MSKKDSLTPQAKKDNSGLKLNISLMVIIILFIAELYIIVNRPQNFVALAGITLLLLVWGRIFINAFLQETFRHGDETIEQYQNILKTEKASYLLLKKAFEQMESGGRNVTLPTEEIISAQKALAKLTIGRSRENTDALLNSHDKVMEMLYGFEEKLLQNNSELISSQKMIADGSAQEQMLKQQEIIAEIRETERSLKNEITQVAETVAAMKAAQSTQPMYIQEPARQDQTFSLEEPLSADTTGTAYETDVGSIVPGESTVMDGEQLTVASSEPNGMAFNDELVMPDEMQDLSALDFKDNGLLADNMADLNNTAFAEEPGVLEDTAFAEEPGVLEDAAFPEALGVLEDTAFPEESGDLEDTVFPGELGDLEGTAASDELEDPGGAVFSGELGLMDDITAIGDFAFIDEAFPADESYEAGEPYQQEENSIPDEQLFPEDIPAMENSAATDSSNNLQEASFLDEEPQIGEMAFLDEEPMMEVGAVMEEGQAFQESLGGAFPETEEPLMNAGSAKGFLSGQNQTEEPETSESEELPESLPEQKKVEIPEEKPVAPDLSNPNKMLTPEEIAALIASM